MLENVILAPVHGVPRAVARARDIADQVLFLDGGRAVERGTPEIVLGNPRRPRTPQFP